MNRPFPHSALLLIAVALAPACAFGDLAPSPYRQQVQAAVARLADPSQEVRRSAAEALGVLRAGEAATALADRLGDASAEVRRAAATSLAWCGTRDSVSPLIEALGDSDWSVRQCSWIALTNLTGMALGFDSLGPVEVRSEQQAAWRRWWATVGPDEVPAEVQALLANASNLARGCAVTVSTTYKGPPSVLTDGSRGPKYWQTKEVPFPQWCVIDLGKSQQIADVTLQHYAAAFAVTDCEVLLSRDGKQYESVRRRKVAPAADLIFSFPPRESRFVKVVAHASANSTYPTTLFEVQVHPPAGRQRLRALRAVGYLGGKGASALIRGALAAHEPGAGKLPAQATLELQAGMQALGRLHDPASLAWLVPWLWDTEWARYAAAALGELGDDRAIPLLLAVLPRYARDTARKEPKEIPPDDRTGLSHVDRMYETPFQILSALARLPFTDRRNVTALRQVAPLLLSNLPEDYDGAMLYQREAHHLILGHLLDLAGLRQETCEEAFSRLGCQRKAPPLDDMPRLPDSTPAQLATWLSAFCGEAAQVPRLVQLLSHTDGWVRLNAAKALAYVGDRSAIVPLAQKLSATPPEGSFGFSPRFLDEEFADPTPRCREAYARALGLLGAEDQVPLLLQIAQDDLSAVGIRCAATQALADLNSPAALTALSDLARHNPFVSVRQIAQEALWRAGLPLPTLPSPGGRGARTTLASDAEALVFIKGDNVLKHLFQTDPWRQSYITSDSGPAHRPGRNLYVLRPARPDGVVTPLTRFDDGYVADCEVSWDGTRVIFARRGEKDPWWHLFEINADGTGLRQLTQGPFHDVGPCYLPDGRIVFASSRVGMRDEYHGYPATSLHLCGPDGENIRHLLVNINRDNEPAVLPTGELVFSRLEVFYSRLKTELTLHACLPDGTHDRVLYGPERRDFWGRQPVQRHKLDFFGWVKPLHRVLRLTQPQGLPDGRVVCSTPGGLALVGPDRYSERIIPHDGARAFTTPYPLPDGRLLCASTVKAARQEDSDLGLYWIDPETGELELLYNDPATADYEARPLASRAAPPPIAESHVEGSFTGTLSCLSVHNTQEAGVAEHGRFVRVVEGLPITTRHSTQTNPGETWRNHHGTLARVLGTVPLAPDGSFSLEVPADRLLQLQVLDSDRVVLGNVLTWLTTRPREARTCIGCHERPNTPPKQPAISQASTLPPFRCLPTGHEFRYRAKLWQKGTLTPAAEGRLRTVRAVNLLGQGA